MSRRACCLAPLLALALTASLPAATAQADPMECNPDVLRMALSAGGTMPAELLRACKAVPSDDELYGLAQYMIAVHFERRMALPEAAQALGRAASRAPFATDTRVLYRLSRYLIAAGDLEGALVAKDRLLLNSAGLARQERLALLVHINHLLSQGFEIAAARAEELGDAERGRRALIAARFYRQAAHQLGLSLPEGETVGQQRRGAPLVAGDLPPVR